MRREVVRVAVAAAWIALAVLVLPLGVAVFLLLQSDKISELEREALRAAVQVDSGFGSGDPVELPAPEAGSQLGLYDTAGALRAGTGPAHADPVVLHVLAGTAIDSRVGGVLVVTVPVAGAERVTGVIRAASPTATVWRRASAAWSLLAAMMAAALVAGIAVARHRARRLTGPLEELAKASKAIGDGDFGVRVAPCGIIDLDRVAATQNATAGRLQGLLERERQFSANASHQLRTPLAGLQLGLETALDVPGAEPRAALRDALTTTRRLRATVEDVLALHRQTTADVVTHRTNDTSPSPQVQSLDEALDAAALRWHGPFAAAGRQLIQPCPPGLRTRQVPVVRVGQILDILLDNSLQHGSGQVRLNARNAGSAVAVEVGDEGPGVPADLGDVFARRTGSGHGIGLGLAREFAASLGGRLLLTSRTPPVFTLYLPDTSYPPDPSQPSAAESG